MGNIETNLRENKNYEYYLDKTHDERSIKEYNESVDMQKRSFGKHDFHYSDTRSD